MNIEGIAKVCHQANKAYCEYLGDTSQVDWEQSPEELKESTFSSVKAIIDRPYITPEALFEEWKAGKMKQGYVYGETKDLEKRTHPLLVDYAQLPKKHRLKDALFIAVVRSLA